MNKNQIFSKVYKDFSVYIKYCCFRFYNKNYYRLDTLYQPEDLAQLVYIELWKYLERFDDEKSSLKTYIILIMHTVFKRSLYFSKSVLPYETRSLDYEYAYSLSLHDILSEPKEDIDQKLQIEAYKFHLDPVHKKIYFRVIEQGCTYEQVGKELGVSREMIRLHIEKIRNKIKRLEGIYED